MFKLFIIKNYKANAVTE